MMWLKRVGKWVGYPLFFLLSFVLFTYWLFPWERVRDYVVQEVEHPRGPGGRRAPSGFELEIGELSPSWLTGVSLTHVKLTKVPTTPEERALDVTFEEVNARVGLFAAITGTTSVTFDARLAGGELEGRYRGNDEGFEFALELERINLQRVSIHEAFAPLPLRGVITGAIELELPENPTEAAGRIDLTIAGLKVGDGQKKLPIEGFGDGMTVDRADAGTLRVLAVVDNGVLQIEELRADGEDLALAASGQLRLLPRLSASQLNLLLRVQIKEGYRERGDAAARMVSLLESPIARNNPLLRGAWTDDGAIQVRLTGAVGGRLLPQGAGRDPAP